MSKKREKNGLGNGVALVRVLIIGLIAILVTSLFVIRHIASENPKVASRPDLQTLRQRVYDNQTIGARAYYVNATGFKGYTVYWTTKSDTKPIYRCGDCGTGGESYYNYYAPLLLTRSGFIMDNLYPDPSGWMYKSQATFIFENATGYCAWTYTQDSGSASPTDLPYPRLKKIPIPTATLSGADVVVNWDPMPAWENATGAPNATINSQLVGYFVYRCENNATWNDNTSVEYGDVPGLTVRGTPSDWQLVSGIEPILGTSWTDTSVEIGKTYYFSLKLVFNCSCPVGTMWGGLGSNPLTMKDETPPTITHIPITHSYTDHSIWINATVTDPAGMKEVNLSYIDVNGNTHNVSMLNETQENEYSYKVPAQTTSGTFYYSIWATDNYNNTASHPETGNHAVIILSAAGNISGRVIDSVMEQGIQDAFVTVMQKSVLNSTTNSTGYYIIADVPEGTYTVRAEKTGYENNTRTNVQVVPGQTTTNVDIVLTSLDTAGPAILSTAPENNTVITTPTPRIYANYTGINVNSVILLIDGINMTANATITDINITYIPSEAFSDGMHSAYLELRDAKGNLRSTVWVFIISTKGTVAGIVKDANGNPIEGVTITILGTGYSTTTNSDGHYTIANISAGAYNLKAEMSGYIAEINTGIAVVANQQTRMNFTLSDALGTITGVVRDKDGHLLAGVKITAGVVVTTTNSDGYYTITNLSAGSYNVKAEKAGYESEAKSISIYGGDFKALDFSLEKMQGESKRSLIPSMSSLGTVAVILSMVFIIALWKRRK